MEQGNKKLGQGDEVFHLRRERISKRIDIKWQNLAIIPITIS